MDQTPAPAHRVNNHAGLIWSIADLLRGDYKQSEYGRVILPLVVLRRLDCVLEPTKPQVLGRLAALAGKIENVGPILESITGLPDVYNTSPLTLRKILADPSQVAGNLRAWIAAFDDETRDVIEKFDVEAQIGRLDRTKLLSLVLSRPWTASPSTRSAGTEWMRPRRPERRSPAHPGRREVARCLAVSPARLLRRPAPVDGQDRPSDKARSA